MLSSVSTPRSSAKPPKTPVGRKKSRLTLAAEEAARLAKRNLLAETIAALGWNLSAIARHLEMAGASDVIRALKEAGLEAEYLAAKARGDIVQGRRD